MPREQNPDSGKFEETVTDGDLAEFANNFDERPFFTVGDVTDGLDIGSSQANNKLNDLVDEGVLERTKVGGRAVVYWLPSGE